MAEISTRAGSPLCDCDTPDSCVHKVVLSDGQISKTYPIDPLPSLVVYDGGKGVDVKITIEEKCSKSGCPQAKLQYPVNNVVEEKPLHNAQVNNEKLYYNPQTSSDKLEYWKKITPFEYFANAVNPMDLFQAPHEYLVVTTGCHSCDVRGKINVYPTTGFYIETGFSYEFSSGTRGVKERRDERIKDNKEMRQGKTLPQDRNQLRNGWTLYTDAFYVNRQVKLDVSFKLMIAGKDYSKEISTGLWKKRTTSKKLETISKMETLLTGMETYLMPSPDSMGKSRAYPVASLNVKPLNAGLCYSYRCDDSSIGPSHFFGVTASPFFGAKFKIDLIQVIAAYCKIDIIVSEMRKVLARRSEYDTFSADVDCYLEISGDVHLKIGALHQQEKWSFYYDEGNKLEFGLIGHISAAIRTKVMIAEIALDAKGEMETKGRFELDDNDGKGLDLVAAHDGISASLELKAEASIDKARPGKRKVKKDKVENSLFNMKKNFIIAKKLETKQSACRVNLFGQSRMVAKPAIESGLTIPKHTVGAYPYHQGAYLDNSDAPTASTSVSNYPIYKAGKN
ncbi:hypothetical protein FHU10_0223 [Serratia fonticola]|uniref:Uncharacterized protein n=1 Tax=Serratia fonticola TaxID=47917 RepID=A0A542D5E0_SERFO|nr:hypothetical protein [Serratia fonticola]TQI79678.1 hypothetical protein FHU09_2226 [Serratia fonticola]TQI98296.1 hypothetical protein FHU11_3821 [Serratia fonticola]TVZ67824.1 hypothetical protein FHU10_0223 [Serratia fonticola]